jgi:hypothetical protein
MNRPRGLRRADDPRYVLGWLGRLESGNMDRGTFESVRMYCIKNGLTAWEVRTPEGELISEATAIERFGRDWFQHVKIGDRERITEKGRRALRDRRVPAE